ncbi:hypothetical protein Tco_0717590 [Tanacetum coccineum]
MNNKVEDHPRSVKSNSNKTNRIIEPICNANVKHSMLNANSKLICATYNECMFDAIHDLCVLDFVNDVNVRSKSKSAKSSKKKKIWKPASKVFTDIRYRWKRTFTIDGNTYPLTRITSTKVVPLKETTLKSVITQNLEIKVYCRRPKVTKSIGSSSKSKIVESMISNNSEPYQSWGSNASDVPSFSLVNFRLSKLFSVKCNQCMFDANHDVCFLEFVNDVNVRSKSKSAKSSKKKKIWKPTSKVFTDIRYRWKPTGQTFTIDGNTCPLTRITSTKVVPLKETTSKSVITQNLEIKVYSRRPKVTKSVGSSSKSKIAESRISKSSEPNQSWGSTSSNVPSSSLVNFRLSKF